MALRAKLPEVSSAHRDGDQFTVTGNEDALQAVITVLIRHGIIAQHLRVDQANLDDVFVALTSRGRFPAGACSSCRRLWSATANGASCAGCSPPR